MYLFKGILGLTINCHKHVCISLDVSVCRNHLLLRRLIAPISTLALTYINAFIFRRQPNLRDLEKLILASNLGSLLGNLNFLSLPL